MLYRFLSALQQNRAQSRLLYLFYDKESDHFPTHLAEFSNQTCIFQARKSGVSMEGHSGQKCSLIAPCIPLDRTRVPLDRTSIPLDRIFLPLDRTSIPLDRIFLPVDRTSISLDRTFLPFDRTSIILSLAVLHWFIPVAFHI